MYIRELKYGINVGRIDTSTIIATPGEQILNVDIVYYSSTEDTSGNLTKYSKAGDSIALNSANNIKIKVY